MLAVKQKFAQPSKSLKILWIWTWLSVKPSFAFYVFISSFNYWKPSYLGWNLLNLIFLKRSPRPNLAFNTKFDSQWNDQQSSYHERQTLSLFYKLVALFQRQSLTKCLRQTLVFMCKSALREKFNFYFSGDFH